MTDEPMTDERLEEIRKRERAATKSPWRVERHEPTLTRLVVSDDHTLDIGFGYVGNRTEDDAEFVAHSRDDVPDLIAEVDRLRTKLWQTTTARDVFSALLKEAENRVTELEAQRNHINDLPPIPLRKGQVVPDLVNKIYGIGGASDV